MGVEAQRRDATVLAEELLGAYDSKGFQIFWGQYLREIKSVEQWVIAGLRVRSADSASAMTEVSYRRGFLDGCKMVAQMKEDLLEELRKGRIPWLERAGNGAARP